MASTNIYAVPTENTAVNYELPQNESAKVQFSPSDITGLRLEDGGSLVISLKEGGSVTFTNFQTFIDNGNTLTLADDTVVDPNLLFTALGGQPNSPFADAADVVRVAIPEAGTTNEVVLKPGEKYLLNFDLSETQGADIKNGAMTIGFENGGKIVIPNYEVAMADKLPPELSLASKTCVVTGDELITNIQKLAAAGAINETVVVVEEELVDETKAKSKIAAADMQGNDDIGANGETQLGYKAKAVEPAKKEGEDVANIEPAAGDAEAQRLAQIETAAGGPAPGARNSGYGFGSTPGSDPFTGKSNIGPLDPTSLNYRAPTAEPIPALVIPQAPANVGPNAIGPNLEILDETNLANGPISESGTIRVNFGADGPGGINPNGSFASSGSQTNGKLSSNGSAITVTVDNATNSYVGKDANGQKVFELVVDSATGNYVFTQYAPLDHADGTNPNDEIRLDFGIIARDGDGDSLNTSVTVIIKDDAPIANDDFNSYDTNAGTATGNVVTGLNGGPGAQDVLSQDASNKVVKIAFGGNEIDVPATGTVSINGQYGKLTISADGSYTYDLFTAPGGKNPSPMKFGGNDAPDFDSADKSDEHAAIGIEPGNMNFNAGDKINLKVVSEAGSTVNSVGVFTVDANGNIRVEQILVKNSEAPGIVNQTYSHVLTQDASSFGLFMLADTRVNVNALDYSKGKLEFVYNYGQPDARGAKTTDKGGSVTLVYTDENGVETALGQKLYFTNERGESTDLNYDGLPHVSSGVVGSDGSTLRIGFEDQMKQGDKDFNDLVIDITVEKGDCGCGPKDDIRDEFVYTLRDGDGDIDKAKLILEGKDLIDDVPDVIVPDAKIVDETNLASGAITETGKVNFDFGADGPGTFGGSGKFSSGGSQTGGALSHNGTPVVVTYENGVYTGKAGTVTIFTMTIAADGNFSFKLYENLDHADGTNPNDEITLNFGVVATDCDGDKTEKNIVIKVLDDAPTISGSSGTVDETNLSATTPLVHTGTLTHSFGQDGAGQIVTGDASAFVAGGSLKNGQLSHNGSVITVTATADGYVGTTANGTVAFTLKVNKDTGAYEYKQFVSLDHADASNPNDEITLSFDVKIVDFDGDTAKAPIVITIRDDAPTFPPENPDNPEDPENPGKPVPADGYRIVDETDLPATGGLTTSGKLNADFGADKPGSYSLTPNSFTSSGSKTGGTLSSNGVPVVVTIENGVYVGKAGNTTVFTLTLNPQTGDYTFTLLDTLDHADGNNPNDIITLEFGVQASDSEGDAASGKIRIDVKDDAPIANDDTITLTDNMVATGNVTSNDRVGNDSPGSVTHVSFNGQTYAVTANGTSVQGTYGTLVIKPDGSYTYTANGTTNGKDTFVYTLRDYDGDTDTAKLEVTVDKDFIPVIVKPADEIVDETNLAGGTITETGTVTANFFGDGPGTFEGNGSFASSGSRLGNALTHNGTPVNVTFANGVYTGTAGTKTIFTMAIGSDGKYTFKLFDNLDHADANDPNDIIKLDFGVIAKDRDGDKSQGTTITVQVKDDAPTISGGTGTVDETNLSATNPLVVGGNLVHNFGQDGAGSLTIGNAAAFSATGSIKNNVLSSKGSPITVTATADGYVGKTATGATAFTLKITSSGAYEYKQFLNLDHADDNDPNDIITLTFGAQIKDYDGDTARSNIVIKVVDDAPSLPPQIIKPADEVLDETNLKNGTQTETGKVNANFYNGQTGTITGDGNFTSTGSKLNGNLTYNGQPINVSYSNGTYTGVSGSTTVFTLVVAANGSYTFKLFEQLDHGNPNDPNDVINLNFGLVATDPLGGGTSSTTLTVKIVDDAPIANPNFCTVMETFDQSGNRIAGQTSFSSNALNNDTFGQDTHGARLSSVTYNGQTYGVSAGGTTIQGTYGTLVIKSDGSYTYTSKQNTSNPVTDNFHYTIVDGDGDTATSYLQMNHAKAVYNTHWNGSAWEVWYDITASNGNNAINGSGIKDIIRGGAGNDIIYGGGGDDILYGGAGADTFVFKSISEGRDTIKDFNISQGDKIDISNIITNFDPVTHAINNFVFATHSGGNTIISVNNAGNGAGGASAVAVLEGVTVSVADLFNNGSIVH